MRYSINNILFSSLLNILLLVFFEIVVTTLFPAIGISNLQIGFHVLIIIFLSIRGLSSWLPYLILSIEYTHSIFSVEGWALGTLTGIILALLVNYLKDLLDFSTGIFTIGMVFLLELGWFIIFSTLLCVKMGSFANLGNMFLRFLPEGFVMAIIAPVLFFILDKIWFFLREEHEVHI